ARARFAPHVQGAWEAMAQASFDPEREIVLVAEGAEAASAGVAAPLRARVVVASRRADRVVPDVLLDGPALAVLPPRPPPGWPAPADGAPVSLRSANLLFCAAEVPAGHHQVAFEYHAPGARAGLALTAAGLAALGLLFARRRTGIADAEGLR